MNYLSVCSGVEAATVAWHPLGWNPVAFSEIEKFPSEVLAHHYPTVPNMGDMTKYKEWDFGTNRLDLLVGGTPCQSFSVAGLRKGLDDPRGNLALIYCGILDKFRPKWFVWENVPGVLSSGGGRDFGSFLGAVAELGYGFSYRVLDAQNFGVAQRRRRVFVVGCLGDWRDTAKVLFEPDCLRGDIKKSRGKGKATTRGFVPSVASTLQTTCNDYSRADGFNMIAYENHPADSRITELGETCSTVTSRWGTGGGNIPFVQAVDIYNLTLNKNTSQTIRNGTDIDHVGGVAYGFTQCDAARDVGSNISPTLRSGGDGGYPNHAVAFAQNQLGELREGDVFNTLNTNSNASGRNTPLLRQNMAVRRLTPIECERLQGFPDDYTNIKDKCPDGPRYKAMGNSMAVPVMNWIGKRIQMVEDSLL